MAKFKLHPSAFKEMLRMPGITNAVAGRAESVANAARSNAPFDSGSYKDSIQTQQMSSSEGGWNQIFDRPITRVIADVDHAAVVESRTRNLGRAADAAGGS